jgi:CubicO group peptidase (beta-lactamase class C family)
MVTRTLALAILASGCLFDGELKHDGPTTPEPLDDGWAIATPESVGLDPEVLDGIHQELLREDAYVGTLGMLVIKDGMLVWETYLRSPEDRDRRNPLQSATKSVTSLLLGIVRDDLGGPSLDMPIDQVFADEMAEMEPAKHEITLRHLLTMSSGIAFDNEDFSIELLCDRPENGVRYILEKPMYAVPGADFYYRDADPQLVAYVIQRFTGRDLEDIAVERLFGPLGIEDYAWEHTRDEVATGPFGLHLRPRDFAKLGQLVLDRGEWNGERVVSEAWLDESTSAQIETDHPEYPYGYYWWVAGDDGVSAWGHGGQFIFVVPERDLVLVQIARPYADLHGSYFGHFHELVAPLLAD